MSKQSEKQSSSTVLSSDNFLRSINIVFDADHPERISHYFPTEKSANLISKLNGGSAQRSFLVVAPYGSGKSIAAAYALHSTENTRASRPILKDLNDRMGQVCPELGETLSERVKKYSRKGMTISLHGHCENISRDLIRSASQSLGRLGIEGDSAKQLQDLEKDGGIGIYETLSALKAVAEKEKIDRVLVLWDEFGRHLETLISEGRATELLEIQTLAEFASRQKSIPFCLGLFLHQGLLNYANNLPQTIRREWKKIEGRFETIDYVEDSREIYRLIGEILAARKGESGDGVEEFVREKATALKDAGRFSGFATRDLSVILDRACPLSPAAVELLPKISARVSQNERTLFSFLFHIDVQSENEIGADELYDYFSDQMQADVDIGGTHRQWIETESAISKVAGDVAFEKALKVTCLMGLGLAGERGKASREQTILALAGYDDLKPAEEVIDHLISRHLLLHRKHSDEVAIWHGTDLDLRGRLNEEKQARSAGFDLVSFLRRETCAPTWKPIEYNADFDIRRYFISEFVVLSQFDDQFSVIRNDVARLGPEEDGKIFYLIPQTANEKDQARDLILSLKEDDLFSEHLANFERVVFTLPSDPLPIRDAALEVASLLEMRADSDLTSLDPLVIPELQQMLDDARGHLQALIERITNPGEGKSEWIYQGESYHIDSTPMLSRFLSNICRLVYGKTPRIKSEVIVRKKASPVVVNSRKKLLLALLERYGTEGLEIEGNFPDASMFRTVLKETGLYRYDSKSQTWGFASAHALDDEGLRGVWEVIQDFFTIPSTVGKDPTMLFNQLAASPYGVRAAMFPILFAAGMKAFAYTTSLTRDGEYIADILPTDIELICKEPHRHLLKVLELGELELRFVDKLRKEFSAQPHRRSEVDVVRHAHEALQSWYHQLPIASTSTSNLTKEARGIRNAIGRGSDPVNLILTQIPGILRETVEELGDPKNNTLASIKREIEDVVQAYRTSAEQAIRTALKTEASDLRTTREISEEWALGFGDLLPPKHEARPLVFRMANSYDSDEKLVDSIAGLPLVSRVSIERWTDDDVRHFADSIDAWITKVETDILAQDLRKLKGSSSGYTLTELLGRRVDDYLTKICLLAGEQEMENLLQEKLANLVVPSKDD